jgi:deoxyribose-phosphate aldolase
MSLSSHLDTLLIPITASYSMQNLFPLLDLTLLDYHASQDSLSSLYEQGVAAKVAALCVFPKHLSYFTKSTLRLATVMNFPEGSSCILEILKAIDEAVLNHAQEIDYVFPYQAYLRGQTKEALKDCVNVVNHCHQSGLTVKIIIEVGAFNNLELLYQSSLDVITSGCDFIKTSTGKIAQGASLSAAVAMLAAIKDSQVNCGIKFSGGIRSQSQAFSYLGLINNMFDKPITADWVRFGSSSLLE